MKNKVAILAERYFALIIFSALVLAPTAAFAGLTEFFSATGKLFLSVDGAGSNNASHTAQVEKPNASTTVRQAFVLAASAGFSGRVLNNGDVAINGTPINWDARVPGAIANSNHRADVTSIVKPIIDAASPGRVTFTFTEVSTSGIDGEILVVVFDDPLQTADSTVSLLFGAQNISGDTFSITLAEPIDPTSPGAVADMGLGISFGFQGTSQFSIVNVNGRRLTSSAGGQDDGLAANGGLITVGGLDDSNANPNSDAFPSDSRTDDERYSLIQGNSVDSNPFISPTDTSISVFTQNPSNDDNIFFAYFHLSGAAIVGEGIVLSPTGVTNPVGTQHTVTAKVSNDNGAPVLGTVVTFNVISGPNTDDTGTDTTDVNGEATFTYTGDGGAGTDQIQASFVDSQAITKTSNTVTNEWTSTEANTPPVADPQSVTTAENTPKSITLTGSDADGDPLTFIIVTPPQHGALSEFAAATKAQLSRARSQMKTRLKKEKQIPGTRGFGLNSKELAAIVQSLLLNTVMYFPDPNYNGPDSFTFKANDGASDSNVATVDINVLPVNAAPVANNVGVSTNEDTPVAVTLSATDIDSGSLTFSIVAGPSNGALGAFSSPSCTSVPNGTGNPGSNCTATVTYTPGANFAGSDSFTFKVNDGSLNSNTALVLITVNAVDDAPVATNDSYNTDEDTPLSIGAPGVLGNDTDIDTPASSLTAILVSGLGHAASFTFNPNGSFSYTPAANFNGTDTFTYKVNDGTRDSAPATVNITVKPQPDPPEIQNLRFARRTSSTPGYLTPGIAALLEFRDVDGDTSVRLEASLTARNVPKGCGSDVLPSDPLSISFSEVVNDPDADPFDFEAAEVKALEIGPQAMKVAQEHGCQVTLELTSFDVQGVDPSGRRSNVLTGSFSIDSDNGAAAIVATTASRQLSSSGASRKIAPPVVR